MGGRNPIEDLAHLRHEFGEHGGVNMSVEASSTFTVIDPETMPDLFQGRAGPAKGCYLYGRHFNPTVYNLGRQMAALAGTDAAYCAASGMGAISAVMLCVCNAGDEIVASNTIYGGSFALLNDFLPAKSGIRTHFVDITEPWKMGYSGYDALALVSGHRGGDHIGDMVGCSAETVERHSGSAGFDGP